MRGRPKVMTVHSAGIKSGGFETFMLDKLYHPFARRVLRKMDMLIALSEGERKSLLRCFGLSTRSVVVIPNGIKIDEFTLDKIAAEEFVRRYRLKEDSFKVLSVGRLVPQKNPEKLISTVAKHMKDQNVEVIFIGGGSPTYLAKLREISDERIHVLEEVKFEELVAAYHSSNLFVFLGTWEGIPTVILEAMLCGLPVVAAPVGGIPEVITEKENGLFVELPISEEDLANKISYFMNMNKADTIKISKANMKKIKTHYNWELLADEILDVYNQVLGV